MTNPSASIRLLVTYAICIPVAIFVGYLITNPLDYGTLGYLGLVLLLLALPIVIKWHYPILVFGLGFPMTCFFLIGNPPFSQVAVILSFGIAIVERTINNEKRFIRVPAMTWPLLFILAMTIMTAQLTGGIGLHALGGGSGGGKKYIAVFIGVFTYFALTTQRIPREKWKLYLMMYMLPAVFGMLGDFFPFLPSPLNYLNLLFPPSSSFQAGVEVGTTRLVSFSFAIGIVPYFLIARYGLRGIFLERKLWRPVLMLVCFGLALLGGFRNIFAAFVLICALMFFLEGLHRTRLLPILLFAGILGAAILSVSSDKLPYTVQRSMSFLPLKWNTSVIMDADGSSDWRYRIWRAVWPKVPEYLLLGKGYGLSKDDFEDIGQGTFARSTDSHISGDEEALAISGDYHSGPLTTLIPFGIWGAIGIVWLMAATAFVTYRNYIYGPLELKTFNAFMLASCITSIIFFLFVVGAFQSDLGNFAKIAGFSIAMNWGVAKRPPKTAYNPAIHKPAKPLTRPDPQPA